uniref:KH_dom_type_1 domain-containing protein n=1 Tax=Rhabditophanes sp. KR3021 TaxID=114890 RepID=A0AC35UDU4_9BILA
MTKIVVPGDYIGIVDDNSVSVPIIGRGLKLVGKAIYATQAGVYMDAKDGKYVDVRGKKYTATVDDIVIGVVTNALVDNLKVDIGVLENASLPTLAFEGATKKNRPAIKIGDLVYTKIVSTSKWVECELTCIDKDNCGKGLGALPLGGMVIKISLNHARRLLSPKCNLLKLVGAQVKHEIAIGLNGRVWIKANKPEMVKSIINIIQGSEMMADSEVESFVNLQVGMSKGFTKEELMETN